MDSIYVESETGLKAKSPLIDNINTPLFNLQNKINTKKKAKKIKKKGGCKLALKNVRGYPSERVKICSKFNFSFPLTENMFINNFINLS